MSNISLPNEFLMLNHDGSINRVTLAMQSNRVLSAADLAEELSKDIKLTIQITATQKLVWWQKHFYIVTRRPSIMLDSEFIESPEFEGHYVVGAATGNSFRMKLQWDAPKGSELYVITKTLKRTTGIGYCIPNDGTEMWIFLTDPVARDGLGYIPPLSNIYNIGKVCTGIRDGREAFNGQTPFVVNRLLLERFDSSPFNSDLLNSRGPWCALYKPTESGLKQIEAHPNAPETHWSYGLQTVSNDITQQVLFAEP